MRKHGFLIAAPQSGSGKTTVSLAIMAALTRRGMVVAPFKCGPDFIDPGYHQAVTGRVSINLDGWICPEEFVRNTFRLHTAAADCAVIEGVMGLFDGIGAASRAGSTAEIAAITAAPVVLVVNARGMAASAAALVSGFAGFDPQVSLAGVIFNNVGSDSHAELLREALAVSLPELPVFGCILRDDGLSIPSRHLGLMTVDDNPLSSEFVDRLADMAERCLDLDGLAELIIDNRGEISPYPHPDPLPEGEGGNQVPSPSSALWGIKGGLGWGWVEKPARIAVARDAAFCFCYEDNLRLLREAGAETVFFSPLADTALPMHIQGIYLPGGYPELYAERLAANSRMLAAIRAAVEQDMPVYAECGGLIYLTEGMQDGVDFVGVFPVRARMLPKRKALGYRQVEICADSMLGRSGTVARGHEFHYSEIGQMPPGIERTFRVTRRGEELGLEGYHYRNCLSSYIHLHFGSSPDVATGFVRSCRVFEGYKDGSVS
jgi:cobyrinic acid a,c-diamide synthase